MDLNAPLAGHAAKPSEEELAEDEASFMGMMQQMKQMKEG